MVMNKGSLDIRDRVAPLTREVVTEIVRAVPAFANAPDAFRDVVELVVQRIVALVVELLLSPRAPTRAEVRDLVEVCVPSTDMGITLEDMLAVFALAQTTLWRELRRAAADGALTDPDLALELSQVGSHLLTELSRGVTAEYLRGDRVWLQRRDAERTLLRGVLDAPPRTEQATRAAHALDLRLLGHWRCAVYEWVDPQREVTELHDALEDARLTWGVRGALAADASTVLLASQDGDPLPAPSGARVGIGAGGDGAQGLRRSRDEAADALAVARRRGALRMTSEQARLGRVVLGSLSPDQLAAQVLAPLDAEPEGRREMLLETLAAWLDEQGSPTAVAHRLRLHVQSARYRITQLRSVLGDALDDPDQRLQLHLAVATRRLGDPV